MESRITDLIYNKKYRIWYLDEGRVRTKNAYLLEIKEGVIFYYNIEHGYIEGISNGRLLRMESANEYRQEDIITDSEETVVPRSRKNLQKELI